MLIKIFYQSFIGLNRKQTSIVGNLVHLVLFLVDIRYLDTKTYVPQCLENYIVNLVHLVPFLVGIRYLDTKTMGCSI